MSTIAINNKAVVNSANNHLTLVERFKKYILENSTTLAASQSLILGNSASLKSFMDTKKN